MNIPKCRIKKSIKFDIKRRLVAHMTYNSWKSIPHVSYIYEPDITEFYNEYKNVWYNKITFNTLILKTITEGLISVPELNSYIKYSSFKSSGVLNICEDINIAIPYLMDDGNIVTPVIPHMESKSLMQISEYVENLRKRIKKTNIDEILYKAALKDTVSELKKFNFSVVKRVFYSKVSGNVLYGFQKKKYYSIPERERLTEKDIENGTVFVSNIGSLNKDQHGFITLLDIISPQVFVVGVNAIQEKPGVYIDNHGNKQIGIRKTLPMCLVFDHRAIDFASIASFQKKLDSIFLHPNVIRKW